MDDWVYLKVSPIKYVMRFGKKGKLISRYIGPDRIPLRLGNVAYKLELPQELIVVHPVFFVSMFNKCLVDPLLIVQTGNVGIKDSIFNEEISVQIFDHQDRKMRTKKVLSVKVLLRNQFV